MKRYTNDTGHSTDNIEQVLILIIVVWVSLKEPQLMIRKVLKNVLSTPTPYKAKNKIIYSSSISSKRSKR